MQQSAITLPGKPDAKHIICQLRFTMSEVILIYLMQGGTSGPGAEAIGATADNWAAHVGAVPGMRYGIHRADVTHP